MKKWRTGPLFTPPSLQGTIASAGCDWRCWLGRRRLRSAKPDALHEGQPISRRSCASSQLPESDTINAPYSLDRGASAARPDSVRADDQRVPDLPINKPPYGKLTAIDMSTGEHRWQVTLGDNPSVRNHPMLRGLNLPPLGVAGAPGPIVTAGGLLFITGGGSVLYALDSSNGSTLWSAELGGRGYSVPMTFRSAAGRQYVVVAVGAGENAVLKAFALN